MEKDGPPVTLGTYLPSRLQGRGNERILGAGYNKWVILCHRRHSYGPQQPAPYSPGRGGADKGGAASFMVIGQVGDPDLTNTMVYNTRYDKSLWKPMHNIIKYAKSLWVYLPPSPCNYKK